MKKQIGLIAARTPAVDTYWQIASGNWGTGGNWTNAYFFTQKIIDP